MEKEKFAKLAKLFGFNINEEAISLATNEEKYDEEKPDNWSEMTSEEHKAWMEKHMVKQQAAETATATIQNASTSQNFVQNQVDENLTWLNSLISDMGGKEAFQSLLLNAVKAVEMQQNSQKLERETLVATLVQNSVGQFAEDELKEMDLPVLQKMAKIMIPQSVNYGPLASGLQINEKELALMPDIFSAETWKKEA
jgi:hypothetical protein